MEGLVRYKWVYTVLVECRVRVVPCVEGGCVGVRGLRVEFACRTFVSVGTGTVSKKVFGNLDRKHKIQNLKGILYSWYEGGMEGLSVRSLR